MKSYLRKLKKAKNTRVNYRKHHVLVNKKTKAVASSNSFKISAAAAASVNGDLNGIMAALPLEKAELLLEKNELVKKNSRNLVRDSVREITRRQALEAIPTLAVFYHAQLPAYRPPRINEFCRWIVYSLRDRSSQASVYAVKQGFDELLDANRNARWWQDQLKKMQS